MKLIIKFKRVFLLLALFLFLGMGSGYLFEASQVRASTDVCYEQYCHEVSGECMSSEGNQVNCLAPGGTEPCTRTENCEDDPGQDDPSFEE